MPRFLLEHPDGRRFVVEGPSAPGPEDIERILGSLPAADRPPEPSAGERARKEITDEIDAKTDAAAPDETLGKAQMTGAAALLRAVSDPIVALNRVVGAAARPVGPVPSGDPLADQRSDGKPLAGVQSLAADAETAARGMRGNETLAEVAGAVGSGAGSVPFAFVPGGPVVSAVAAGGQGYESTRREAFEMLKAAGLDDADADRSAHRVALQSGTITAAVTGAFNAFGPRVGLGRGVERGLGEAGRKALADELSRSAVRPVLRELIREAGGEATEEATDQLLQETLVRWQYDSGQTFADAAKNVLKSGLLGGVAGVTIGGIPAAAGTLEERRQATAALRAPDATEARRPAVPVAPTDAAAETPKEIPAAAAGAARKPGTYVYGTQADGKPFEAYTGKEQGSAEAVRDYIEKAIPGAKVERVEYVEAPAPPTTEDSTVDAPPAAPAAEMGKGGGNVPAAPTSSPPTGTDKETPAPGVTPPAAGGAGVVAPAPILDPTPPPPPEPPPAPRPRNAGLEAIEANRSNRPPDLIDWITENVGTIRTKAAAGAATQPYYGHDYDDARQGSGRNLFSPRGAEADVAAQQAFDAGQIPEPSIGALLEGIAAARRGRAQNQSRSQAESAEAAEVVAQADRFDRAGLQGKRSAVQKRTGVEEILAGDLMPGDQFKVAGETVTVRQFVVDPDTDEITGVELEDGRKFGTQIVEPDARLTADAQTWDTSRRAGDATGAATAPAPEDTPFSLRREDGVGDFFAAPESIEEQKARLAREEAERKRAEDRRKMLERQAAPIVGRPVDTTADMFDPTQASAPLFAQTPPGQKSKTGQNPPDPTPKRPVQDSLFSTRPESPEPSRSMTVEGVEAFVKRIFGGSMPPRVVVSGDARKSGANRVEGAFSGGQVVLYAPNLRGEADVRRVLRHELLHDVFTDPKVAESWRFLRRSLTEGDRQRVRAEGYSEGAVEEEAALDAVEGRVDKKAGVFRRWVGTIVDALNTRGAADWAGAVFGLNRLADSDARLLVRYAMRLDRAEAPRQQTERASVRGTKVTEDEVPPYGIESKTMAWDADGAAKLTFTEAGDTVYILGIKAGQKVRGTAMLKDFRAGPGAGKRVKVVGAGTDVFGFWDKMQARGLIDEWTDEDVDSFFDTEDSEDDALYSLRPDIRSQIDAKGTRYGNAVVAGPELFSLRAFHGSGAVFDRFDASKVGSGEGAQAYGWGLYFAQKEDVAENYRVSVGYDPEEMRVNGRQINSEYNRVSQEANKLSAEAAAPLYEILDGLERIMSHKSVKDVLAYGRESGWSRQAMDYFRKGEFSSFGALYQVELDAEPDELLDLDKGLKAQPKAAQDALRDLLKREGYLRPNDNGPVQLTRAWAAWRNDHWGGDTGFAVYEALGGRANPKAASEFLASIGVKGAQYLDEQSRDRGRGTRNFVMFTADAIRIVKRDGKPVDAGERLSLRRWEDVEPYLSPDEQQGNKLLRRNVARILRILPPVEDVTAAALAGRVKRGWYARSARALRDVFGSDSDRFAALLAALSPQCSVETNLANAINTWVNWVAAGRPQSRAEIVAVMGRSVQGDKGEDSVLEAWENNSVRALTAEDPASLVLSGPKVNSFAWNLRGFMQEVTLDTWIANFLLVDQAIFSGKLNKAGTKPGKGAGYRAVNALFRAAAQSLSEMTGETWTPAEVQETVWSWAKALTELSEETGLPVSEVVARGLLTDSRIAETPDFGDLLSSEAYASRLAQSGIRTPQPGGGVPGVAPSQDSTAGQGGAGSPGGAIPAVGRLSNLLEFRRQRAAIAAELKAARDEADAYGRKRIGFPNGKPVPAALQSRIRALQRRLDRIDASRRGIESPDYATERFSLSREILSDPSEFAAERERQAEAGRAVTPLLSELAHDGLALQAELGQAGDVFDGWAKAMVERVGPAVRPFLRRAWEDMQTLRLSLGSGISPEAQADIDRIKAHAANAPERKDRTPVPVYDPEKTARWWMPLARPSAVIRFFGGEELLRKRQLLDLRTAYQAAAVKEQAEQLTRELEDSFYGDSAGPVLRFIRQFAPKAKLRRFMKHALPIASHLNVTGGTPGAWEFADFEQRAGFMPESAASRLGITTGADIWQANPITGEMETLTLGALIELENGSKGFQILRPMTAERQRMIYDWARAQFGEFQWFLDTWLDPRLRDTRVTIAGVEVPVFNRWALATRYAQSDPTFATREAYTPDVSMGMGLLSATRRVFQRERKVTFREGTVSPGRKYETGTAREAGNTLDLLSGFNVRAMQVLQEEVRKAWREDVFRAAQEIPREGLPAGWTPIENAMADVWRAVQTMRRFSDPNFPQTTARLADDDSPEFKVFFGELLRLRNADKPMMVPKPLVEALAQDYATTEEIGMVARIARVWARNWKAFLLLMPDTFVENRTDNYLRMLMHGHRQMILAAFRGGDRAAFREGLRVAWAGTVGVIPWARRMTGLNRDRLFREMVDEVLPDEIFAGGNRLMDLWTEKGSAEEDIASLLAQGRRGRAALEVGMNLGPLILEKTGYGQMDVAAKQQFAFSVLLAEAETEAARRGLTGDAREAFIESAVKAPPEESVRRAVAAANRSLLNYADTPGWIGRLVRNPVSNLFLAFPLFRYHFIGREIDRAGTAFRSAFRVLVRGKKLTRDQWAEALADTVSYITLPLMGYTAAKIAGALADSLVAGGPDDDDEDRDPREFVGASSVFDTLEDGTTVRKPLPRELVAANRVNVSAMLRQIGVETDSESDWWWHIKDYPLIRSTALVYLAAEDTRRHGPVHGLATLVRGMTDMLASLAGTGQAVKVPEKIMRTLSEAESGRPEQMLSDPYATAVPLDAYLALQALNLIPAQRQAEELVKWLDPVPRRMTRSKVLGYDPGALDALQAYGWTGLADRMARGLVTGDPSSPLPPQGRVDRRSASVVEPREFDLATRIASIMGQNLKPVPRREYREALSGGGQ